MNKTRAFIQRVYGIDRFNKALFVILILISVIQAFARNQYLYIAYAIVFSYMLFRMFSKQHMKRYLENQKYLQVEKAIKQPFVNFVQGVKDFPKFKYFKCSKCRTKVRIPRKKGNVMITCPKCKNRFAGRS